MTSIPASWAECYLGEAVAYGDVEPVAPADIPSAAWVLELEDIERDSSRLLERLTFGARQSRSAKNRFFEGDVLYGKLRPYLNKIVRAGEDGYCTTEIVPIRPPKEVDSGFLFYALKRPEFLNTTASGVLGAGCCVIA